MPGYLSTKHGLNKKKYISGFTVVLKTVPDLLEEQGRPAVDLTLMLDKGLSLPCVSASVACFHISHRPSVTVSCLLSWLGVVVFLQLLIPPMYCPCRALGRLERCCLPSQASPVVTTVLIGPA